jgi:hypothetical protein
MRFIQKAPRKVHVNTVSVEEKRISKKTSEILAGTRYQKKGFTILSVDEFIFYDSLVRRVWILGKKDL